MSAGKNGVAELEETFRSCGLTFRHFESATCEMLRWQAGRTVEETAVVPAHIGTGSRRYELTVKKFYLLACASTSDELAERLVQLPSIARAYRELLE
jgi:hypothetical protein